uniref:Uncharacterized protein n=1 Tax=Timema monikensis TaxID=170555 RepID=A0A7R9EJE6_9NEOP|nr:unnamed protein product [Timema monikensis]
MVSSDRLFFTALNKFKIYGINFLEGEVEEENETFENPAELKSQPGGPVTVPKSPPIAMFIPNRNGCIQVFMRDLRRKSSRNAAITSNKNHRHQYFQDGCYPHIQSTPNPSLMTIVHSPYSDILDLVCYELVEFFGLGYLVLYTCVGAASVSRSLLSRPGVLVVAGSRESAVGSTAVGVRVMGRILQIFQPVTSFQDLIYVATHGVGHFRYLPTDTDVEYSSAGSATRHSLRPQSQLGVGLVAPGRMCTQLLAPAITNQAKASLRSHQVRDSQGKLGEPPSERESQGKLEEPPSERQPRQA